MNQTRREIITSLFPEGIPRLWCPPLTHFTEGGEIDEERMTAHLRFLLPWVSSFLLPGTTGEGWQLSTEERARLLAFSLKAADELGFRILVGILEPSGEAMVRGIRLVLEMLGLEEGGPHLSQELRRRDVAGFTVCPPAGADLDQQTISRGLAEVLSLGLPTALYQLPQVTGNEIAPDSAARLAGQYPNLFLVKDSSGGDRLATSESLPDDLFLARGAEGGYLGWYRGEDGPYDGFLLGSANSFARELAQILDPGVAHTRREELSRTVSAVIEETFDAVGAVAEGNPFTNANKAIDHFNAYGPAAPERPAPLLHGGARLPQSVIERTGAILERHGLLPEKGYLETAGRGAR